MTAGSRSSPAMISAGSPGSNCCRQKMMIETKKTVGTSCSKRRAIKLSIFTRPCCTSPTTSLLEPQAYHPDEAIGHLLVALELRRVRDQDATVVEVKLWIVGQDDLCE